MPIEMNDFILRAGHLDLVKLHRSQWANITRQPDTGLVRMDLNRKALAKINPAFARYIIQAADDKVVSLMGFWIGMADGLAKGPKMVRPKPEDCAQLQDFLLTIPLVRCPAVPDGLRRVAGGVPGRTPAVLRRSLPPGRLMFHQDPKTGLVVVAHVFRASHHDNITATLNGGLDCETIERLLRLPRRGGRAATPADGWGGGRTPARALFE